MMKKIVFIFLLLFMSINCYAEKVAPPKLTITNGIKITGGLTIE